MTTFASTAFAQLGSSATDLVYTPVTPCRVFDTRPSQGGTGPIGAGGTKSFVIWGVSSYAAQGGSATNCGLTASGNTAAVAINVTVVTPASGGFVTAYPAGGVLPTAATVNFQAGDIARGNFTIAKVRQSGTPDLSVYSTSNADVVGDVVGFYAKPVLTPLEVTEVSTATSQTTFFSVTSGACPSNYSVTGAGHDWTAGATDVWFWQVSPRTASNDVICRGNVNRGGAASTITCTAICGRIPGR